MKKTLKNINNFLFSWRKGLFMYLMVWGNAIAIVHIVIEARPHWFFACIGIVWAYVAFNGFKALKGMIDTWNKKEYRNRIE